MELACELCKKVFKVADGKVTSRGSTVHCPRCKHPHLIKRVVEPYPIDAKFKNEETKKDPTRPILTGTDAMLTLSATGDLKLQRNEEPPPTSERAFKPTYNWKEFLKKQSRNRRALSLGASTSIVAQLARTALYFSLGLLVVGIFFFKSMPAEERAQRLNFVKGQLEHWVKSIRKDPSSTRK